MKWLIALILILILISNCDLTDPSANNRFLAENYYPLKIGNRWVYNFSTPGEIAIVERIFKNNIIHEDGSNIWGYTETVKVTNPNPNEPVVGYYTLKSDGLYFYSSDKDTMFSGTSILCRKELILKSPVKVGTQWVTNENALCRITNISNYKIFNKDYPNTVLVIYQKNQFLDSSWYSLNIGLIKRVLTTADSTQYQSITKWELEEYSLL